LDFLRTDQLLGIERISREIEAREIGTGDGMKPKGRGSLIQVLKDFFRRESDQCGIEMAFLYGSWARGYPMKGSDVDLAVCF
ncbi:MAG: hypothetical protein KAT86_01410, partial [Candidatus Latescibacteria bacterium]|nr:hypothetical protein [Candidatus Latescibacterota bacterium]